MTASHSFPAVGPEAVDVRALNHKRLAALRGMLSRAGYGACVLFDPFNQRWATGSRNMFLYFLRNATRYVYIPLAGPVISFDLVVLNDDKNFFPFYVMTPVVRKEVLDKNPKLGPVLESLSAKLDSETMQKLNAAVDVDKKSMESVAAEFLKQQGLIKG